IYGMGGIGKTALAFKLAEKLRDRYPDGQLMVDLRGTDQEPLKPAEAMAQIIHSFDHSIFLPKEENVLAGLYRSILGSKRALLLLDNAADDHQVQPLLPPSTCCVLITSRKKFTLPGLARMDLNTLNPSDARNLLIAISGRISDQTGELAQLCGYMPLALRATGSLLANTTDLDLAKYVEELRAERTRLDRIGSKGVDLNVEASFNLSYRRLTAGAAITFQLTSIFPADFDARAEEIICLDEGHMQLSELVRWSLVEYQVSGEDGRYHLNNLARLFSNLKLEQENGAATMVAAQQRHAEHYRNVLSSSDWLYMQGGDGVLAGLKLFDLEWTNIQAGQAWAEKNLEGSSPAAALCSNYPAAGAYVLDLRLHPSEKIRWLMTALVAARQLKDRNVESVHLGNLGLAYAAMSDVRKAIDYYEQALAIAREIGDRRGEGNA
ncbi:MAG: NB-ARC domain-containing protein, partial [Methanothrix sp.]